MNKVAMISTALMLTAGAASAKIITDVKDCPTIESLHSVSFTLQPLKIGPNFLALATTVLNNTNQEQYQWVIGSAVKGKNANQALNKANNNLHSVSTKPELVNTPNKMSSSPIACVYSVNGTFIAAAPLSSDN